MRTVFIEAIGKRVSLGAYVKAVKRAKANPTTEFPHTLNCWWPGTGADIRREFIAAMQHRITDGVSYSARGL